MRTITNLTLVLFSYFYHYNNCNYHNTYLISAFKAVYVDHKKWAVNTDYRDILCAIFLHLLSLQSALHVLYRNIKRWLALALLVASDTNSEVSVRVGGMLQRARARIRGRGHIDSDLIRRVDFTQPPPPPPPPGILLIIQQDLFFNVICLFSAETQS